MRFCLWLGLALPLCCAGCLVGPDFSSPSAPVAEKWLESDNPSVDTRNQEYRDWWTVFHDPVLNRLIEIAYNQNLTLVDAGTRVLEARAQLGVAIGEFYPQVQQGNGSVTYIRPSHADTTAVSSKRHTQLLARLARSYRQLGIGFLGQVPARHRIRRCVLSRLDRQLRLRAGHPARQCRYDLYRHSHLANADRDRPREHRQAEEGARDCARPSTRAAPRPSSTSTRRKTSSGKPNRRFRS